MNLFTVFKKLNRCLRFYGSFLSLDEVAFVCQPGADLALKGAVGEGPSLSRAEQGQEGGQAGAAAASRLPDKMLFRPVPGRQVSETGETWTVPDLRQHHHALWIPDFPESEPETPPTCCFRVGV